MSILHRHVTKQILAPFTIAFVMITFLVVIGNLLKEIASRFMNNGLGLREMALLFLYALPSLATYTIPIALLFATLIAFVQLSQDCEIIAMKSAGIPVRKIFIPAIVIGLIAALFLLLLKAEVSPRARLKLKSFLAETVLRKPTLVLSEQAWTREFNNMRIFVGDIDDEKMRLRHVNIIINNDEGPRRNIVAKSGKIYIGENKDKVFLELKDGVIHEYDLKAPDIYTTASFRMLTIPVDIYSVNRYINKYNTLSQLNRKEMTLGQIIMKVKEPSVDFEERRGLLQQIGERTALAFMPLAFVLIGAPLGVIPHKARRMYGLSICTGLVLAYYSLLILGETMAKWGMLNPLVAMWIPNLFLGMAGAFLMARVERN